MGNYGNVNVKYKKRWAWGWGVFLLLIAALVLTNQFGGFLELGAWSIIVSALAVAFIVQCFVNLSFGTLPIPIAALYYIFYAPLGLPEISFWPLVLVTVLATAGLTALLPNKLFWVKKDYRSDGDRYRDKYRNKYGGKGIAEEIIVDVEDAVEGIAADAETSGSYENEKAGKVEEGGEDNNPHISVSFGGASRYLHADSLETVELDCNFGGLEVYFDHVTLSPKGAEAFLDCKFGAIELYVPAEWRIVDNMRSSLGAVEINGRRRVPADDAPVLKLTGNVSFGAVEVNII